MISLGYTSSWSSREKCSDIVTRGNPWHPVLRDCPNCCRSKWNSGKKWFQSSLFLNFLCFLAVITLIYDHKPNFDLLHLLLGQVKKIDVSRPDFHKNKSGWALFVYFQHFYYCQVNAFFTNYYPTPWKSKSSSVKY